MFTHDIIKIIYIREGYLPNYPYHLTTDKEMFDAFLAEEDGFFATNYPCIDEDFEDIYNTLLDAIKDHISNHLENNTELPDWVYSFMLGIPISIYSDEQEISDLYDLLNIDITSYTDQLVYDKKLASECYKISKEWVKKLPKSDNRPPSLFGEAHVIKSLRLQSVDVLS